MPPFVCRLPVRFADVDHARIVYYPVFFHYFHQVFEEFFRTTIGARAYVTLLDDDRIGFPSVNASCDFVAPLRFGDTAEIEMRVARLGDKSVTFGYRIYRVDEDDPEAERTLAAQGLNTCAIVDLQRFCAVTIPDAVRALLAPLADQTP